VTIEVANQKRLASAQGGRAGTDPSTGIGHDHLTVSRWNARGPNVPVQTSREMGRCDAVPWGGWWSIPSAPNTGALMTHNGSAPLDITGSSLRGITYTLPVASAQVKSSPCCWRRSLRRLREYEGTPPNAGTRSHRSGCLALGNERTTTWDLS